MHGYYYARNSVQVNARYNVQTVGKKSCYKAAMENDWKKRLEIVLRDRNLSKSKASLMAGRGRNYVQQLLAGKDATLEKLMAVLSVLGDDAAFYVLTGKKLTQLDLEFLEVLEALPPELKLKALALLQTFPTVTEDKRLQQSSLPALIPPKPSADGH